MRNIVHSQVEEFILNHTKSSNALELEMEEYAQQFSIPIITKDTLSLLKNILLLKKPKEILEFGTAIGYSSIQMLNTLNGNCNITTIERNEIRHKEAIININKAGYQNNIRLILAEATQTKEYLDRKYDMVFIDAAKGQYQKFFDLAIDHIKDQGVIISDNIFHNGIICEKNISNVERRQRTIYKRMNDYLDFLTKAKYLLTTLVPIGDGLAITIVNRED